MRFAQNDWLGLNTPISLRPVASCLGLLWLSLLANPVRALPSVSSRAIDLLPHASPAIPLPAEAQQQNLVLLPPVTSAVPGFTRLEITDPATSLPVIATVKTVERGGVGAAPPARGSTPAPRPKHLFDWYNQDSPIANSQPATAPDIAPATVESSPLLQRWLRGVPDVLDDIKRDPSFRTRLRVGYSYFPSSDKAGGINISLEDLFIGRTGLTLSGDYHIAFNGKREAWGTDLRYYVLPLGGYINVAPVLGYRYLETNRYTTDGLNVGLRVLLVPTRTGAADISLTQTWVNPRTDSEVGLTTLSFGYALTRHLRLSTDLQKQNSRYRKDSRVGISLEWMF